MLKIKFGERFSDIEVKILHISKNDVIQTVTVPVTSQIILINGLDVRLFLQKEKDSDSFLLVMGRYENDVLSVDSCFRVLPSLLKKAMTNEPIILLQQLAFNFGVPIQIGNRKGKFFFRERIPLPEGSKKIEVVKIIIPEEIKGFRVISSLFFGQAKGFADICIAFSLELSAYLSWLQGQKTIKVGATTYEVFISYKRKFAEDFASHLKSCLTEEGFPAFLDLIDIPKEFEGSEKWFNIRNEAIRNSKRFLLIMTVGIDKSEEISEELSLARETSGIKFMYLRHIDVEPKITIETKKETIHLDEGNQISFGTKEDLARKVVNILRNSLKTN